MKRKVKNIIMIGIIILCIIGIVLVIYNNRDTSKLENSLAYFANINDSVIIETSHEDVKANNYYITWLILFNLILSVNVIHLCLSKLNFKTLKKTYNKPNKIIILIVVAILLTIALTFLEKLFI